MSLFFFAENVDLAVLNFKDNWGRIYALYRLICKHVDTKDFLGGYSVPVFLIALFIVALDQMSKFVIRQFMAMYESIPVIPGFFHITYILNKGAAFGILENQRWFFLAIAVALFFIYFLFRKKMPQDLLVHWGVGLLLGGALGNALDRFFQGAVTDFFDFRIWPVFNVADVGIVIGVCLLLWYSWNHGKD